MALARQSTRIILALAALFGAAAQAKAAAEAANGAAGNPRVPRFVSLKPDRVNVRGGPSKDHDVTWVYTRAGLPVEITAEFENWRRIRDWEGAEGWVYHSLLSGRRTAIITLKSKGDLVSLCEAPGTRCTVTARLQSGVLGNVKNCDGSWCHITGDEFDGWVQQERLWGVYPNEVYPNENVE